MSYPAEAGGSAEFGAVMQALVQAAPQWAAQAQEALVRAFVTQPQAPHPALVFLAMLAVGLLVERLACANLRRRAAGFGVGCDTAVSTLSIYAALRVLFDLAGVAIFALCAWLTLFVLLERDQHAYLALHLALAAVLSVRCFMVVIRAVFAPGAASVRILPLSDPDANTFYWWLLGFSATYAMVTFVMESLALGELDALLWRASMVVLGGLLNLLFNVFIWANRARLARQFASPREVAWSPVSTLAQTLSQVWPVLVTIWMVVLWGNWSHALLLADAERVESMMVAWWITLLFPLADRLFHALLGWLVQRPFVVASPFAARAQRFMHVLQTGFRLLLVATALFALAVAWQVAGVSMFQTEGGERLLAAVLDVGVTLLLAYVVWEVVTAYLDEQMPRPSEASGSADGEGGGAGATRAETLAPLLRGTFVVVLVTVVVLTVLGSLGIEVTPLLAGAGVFGLAIGFGAQKLVQDIISGFFFLLDDAFRRGEYIDVGAVKGTVERISIRSLQLRHHMGNLHTIPFGEIRYLTNFSRDWVMMKLKLRLAYGTDPEQVRKLVKKLGQELLDDPEIGPMFMEPLKSQGVFSMEDDSAVIFRVKFMTRPGDQFVVRKAVYAAINRRFSEAGIAFAHRVVTVRVEDESGMVSQPGGRRELAGAALMAAGDGTLPATGNER